MPPVNGVGKPCAGEPHARIDGRELETERPGHGHDEERPRRKPRWSSWRCVLPPTTATAPAPDPPVTAGRVGDDVVRPCWWCRRARAAAVTAPMRQGHRL